jgi:alpha-L-fucosidase
MNHRTMYMNILLWLTGAGIGVSSVAADDRAKSVSEVDPPVIVNPGFEQRGLAGWNDWRRKQARVSRQSYSGDHALELGPERGLCAQKVRIRPDSRYRLSAMVRTESASEEVQLIASDYGGVKKSVSGVRTEYSRIQLEFQSASTVEDFLITLFHPSGAGRGYVDEVKLTYLGPAPTPAIQSIIERKPRVILSEGDVTQQPDEVIDWFLDAKFGMFIHWGVYAAMDEGSEWVMHNKAYTPEYYKQRAEDPESGFTASDYDPRQWAKLAKTAGMRYMVLTARHHDGYALFDSRCENSWTSVRHLGRDLIREYTEAVRAAGLRVGLYYSPMNWRYPGYYDVYGTGAKPNVWGYETAAGNQENARLMKEEVYEQVTTLLSGYGPIDYVFWDGGWLGQSADPELEDKFWDSGKYQDPENEWPVNERYLTRDAQSGKVYGIMGLARHFQPRMLVNERFGWVGDIHGEEGISATAGEIRFAQVTEKCMPLMKGGWGYRPDRPVFTFEEVAVYLSNCVVRNINLLLNVSPDRHGRIPENQQLVLHKMGRWLERVGAAIYETRGGPWQPRFGEFGFTYRQNKIYCHVYSGYRDADSGSFTTQSLGSKEIIGIKDLGSGKTLPWDRNEDATVTIREVDYSQFAPVTILEITLKDDVY